MLKGIAASAGVSVAKVYKLETPKVVVEKKAGVAEEEVKKEWKNATRKTVIRGRAYVKRKNIAKSTSELDPYIIRAAGWAGTDALENVIQWGSQTSPNRITLSSNY